jgi:hypothetical protein
MPLLFSGSRRVRDLVNRLGLSAEGKREISFFTAPPDFDGDTFVGLMVAKPAIRRAWECVAIQRDQDITLV